MVGGVAKTAFPSPLTIKPTHLPIPPSFPRKRDAILREKQIKKWQRAWKVELIERANPQWRDLYEELQR